MQKIYNKSEVKKIPNAGVWCFGFPHFVTGTLVQTRASIKPIERLKLD